MLELLAREVVNTEVLKREEPLAKKNSLEEKMEKGEKRKIQTLKSRAGLLTETQAEDRASPNMKNLNLFMTFANSQIRT